MSVLSVSGDSVGDSRAAAGVCPLRPVPGGAGRRGASAPAAVGMRPELALAGKFWASSLSVLGACDVDEVGSKADVGDGAGLGVQEECRLPERATLSRFIERAEELGGLLCHRHRSAFAPGGRGSRFQGGSSPRFPWLGDAAVG
jgi:hypothetical protein